MSTRDTGVMPMNNVGFGIIGCGMIAEWHAEAIGATPGAELIGVTDTSADSRDAFASRHSAAAFDAVGALLSCHNVDVVSICTPSGLHEKLAVAVMNARKPVVIEKPMAITVEGCDAIIHACERNNVKVSVVSQLRFADGVQRVWRMDGGGALGVVQATPNRPVRRVLSPSLRR